MTGIQRIFPYGMSGILEFGFEEQEFIRNPTKIWNPAISGIWNLVIGKRGLYVQ